MKKLSALVELARPGHWLKNLLVFAALLFSRNYPYAQMWLVSAAAFIQFCLLSSAVYAFNDIFDCKADAAHPRARNRPIPSGRVGLTAAATFGIALLAGAGAVSFLLPARSLAPAGAYLALNILYNAVLRRRAILDVVTIAMGFVIRAIAGGVAINVPVSVWLIVCTFMLCLFLALIKRRAEVVSLGSQAAAATRTVHAFYTELRLDHMLAVSAGLAVVTYTFYCLAGPASPGAHMVWTVPVVLYGMFRLYSLAVGSSPAGPVELIRRDPVIWLVALVWLGMVVAVMKLSNLPALKGWIIR